MKVLALFLLTVLVTISLSEAGIRKKRALKEVGDAIANVGHFIKDDVPKFQNSFKNVGNGVVNAGKEVGKEVVNTGKAVGKGVLNTGKAVGKGVLNAGNRVVNTGKAMGEAIKTPFRMLKTTLSGDKRSVNSISNECEYFCHLFLNYCTIIVLTQQKPPQQDPNFELTNTWLIHINVSTY